MPARKRPTWSALMSPMARLNLTRQPGICFLLLMVIAVAHFGKAATGLNVGGAGTALPYECHPVAPSRLHLGSQFVRYA